MAKYTYDQFRKVLRGLGFELVRSAKHEVWQRVTSDGAVLRVVVSHQSSRNIPTWLFHLMLKQAGIDLEQFRSELERS